MTAREVISEFSPDAMFVDGFDDCIIGLSNRTSQPGIVAYDKEKMLQKMVDNGMTYEGALEFFEFNIEGAYVGEHTPCFITKIKTTGENYE